MRYVHGILLIALLMCWGCASDPYAGYGLGESAAVVGRSIDALGGGDRLKSGVMQADAVVTIHDANSTAFVNKHEQVYDLGAGTLQAQAELPDGGWSASASGAGATFGTTGALAGARQQPMLDALRLLRHRVRGPLNLTNVGGTGETGGKPQRMRLPGMDVFRVPVTGGRDDVKAYYFDAETYLLRLVTTGADGPGQEGTVTVYSYGIAPSGKAFPDRLVVKKIGRHVLVGDEPLLEVDFRDVRF